MLPTDQASRLYLEYGDCDLCLANYPLPQTSRSNNQHLYITTDDEIREGDWFIHHSHSTTSLHQAKSVVPESIITMDDEGCWMINAKRVILTSDQTLNMCGVQEIDPAFMDWFVKNPTCEFVKVTKLDYLTNRQYRIYDLPQEEPRPKHVPYTGKVWEPSNQETLEDAAEQYANKKGDIPTTELEDAIFKQGFLDGAKWQAQRMYSEEEVLELLNDCRGENPIDINKWFEQFKKEGC